MIVGMARTSTADQQAGLDAQIRDLRAAGCERVFAEQVSALGERPQLRAMMDFVREGDQVVVTKPCRLARSTGDLLRIIEQLRTKGVGLRILSLSGAEFDTSAPTGRLLVTVLGAISEFEISLMKERQREGVQAAKAAGRYKGRAPTARRHAEAVRKLRAEGVRPVEIARRLSISRASVYALLRPSNPPSAPTTGATMLGPATK